MKKEKERKNSTKLRRIIVLVAVVVIISAIMATVLTGCDPNKKKNESSSSEPLQSSSSAAASSSPASSEAVSEPASSEVESKDEPLEAVAISVENQELLGDVSPYENEVKGWGQGRQLNDKNRPLTCDLYQPKYGDLGGLFIMPDTDKKMYLTFDEGYENGYTAQILDVLKEKACPAVFFVTMPYVKANPDLIKRMIDEGHVIGNHSVNHKKMPTLSPDEQVKEIAGLHNYMVENYNYQMTLFRPPEGVWSSQSMYIAQQLGYKTVLWSFAYLDYDVKNQPGHDEAFTRVTEASHNGAIYLLHAVSKTNTEMLSEVIDKFREDGYSMEDLQEAIITPGTAASASSA